MGRGYATTTTRFHDNIATMATTARLKECFIKRATRSKRIDSSAFFSFFPFKLVVE